MLKKKLFTGICLLSLLSGCVLDDLHDCPGHPDKPVLPNPPEETTLARIPKADHRIIARRQVNGNAMPRPQGFRVNLQRAHKTFPAVKDVHVDT